MVRNYQPEHADQQGHRRPESRNFQDLQEVEEIEKKYNIQEKFVLAKQIGRFKFYSFKN